MSSEKTITASITIGDELTAGYDYKIISMRTGADHTDYYTVLNKAGEEKEYEEDVFDLENK